MEKSGIKSINIEQEMQQSYLDYAMSVIISRALPDARDGLKPVQRRILYAMYDMGIRPDSSFKKSARIVGEVLGKYHPHGDTAVYEAMARLAQDFSIRYPLVAGQGNFGSIDGDPPAAMRYTEAKLDKVAMELLGQIDQDTVGFTRNFDDSLDEPEVLPSALPNLLLNGASGIAVGMATNIPPHNLGELVDAINYILEQWDSYDDIAVDDLMRFIKGPDFPTGGIIVLEDARNELASAYATGRGKLTVRGRVHLEEIGRGRSRIIITEIPYQVNKNGLIERIASLARENVIEGISDLRDESDRQGMRIVIELNKTDDPESILRKLYKHTPLQTTFGIILLALVDNQPRVLTLKQALRVYIDHQLEVIRRRTLFELKKAERRAHILKGLLVAIRNLDEIIKIIRNADTEQEARKEIMTRFQLDIEQAQAILDMPLKRLTHLEHNKLQMEYDELEARIVDLKSILKSPARMREMLIISQLEMKKTYGDARRTQIALLGEGVSSKEVLTAHALVEADHVCVGITLDGKIGRCDLEKINEKGFEIPPLLIQSDTQQTVYVVSETGKAFGVYVETLPKVESFAEGKDFRLISDWSIDEKPAVLFTVPASLREAESASVITVSENAMLKRTLLSELPAASSQSFILCKINADDRILNVLISESDALQLLLATKDGMAIRFDQSDLRPMGLIAAGVNGMKMKNSRGLAGATLVKEKDFCCFVTTDWGLGKITVDEFPVQGRYGQGVKAVRLSEKEEVAGIVNLSTKKAFLLVRYGRNKARQVRPAMVKQVKRAKMLEYFIKLLNHTVIGIELVNLIDDNSVEEPVKPKRAGKKKEDKIELEQPPIREKKGKVAKVTDDDENEPEQISLF